MATLPYVTATGNIDRALRGVQSAATPERVSQDFVKTILKIPGGSGNQMTSFLKKIGFVNADGSPSDLYKKFRNTATSGKAAADALRVGYAPLYTRHEYLHKLPDDELRGLIIEETGQGEDSTTVPLILASLKAIKKFAKWSEDGAAAELKGDLVPQEPITPVPPTDGSERPGLNLSYTINLNLPATSDVAVFNAIFKSLKENLLKGSR
jgi:hypothetical protein